MKISPHVFTLSLNNDRESERQRNQTQLFSACSMLPVDKIQIKFMLRESTVSIFYQ